MQRLSLEERARLYIAAFPECPALYVFNQRIEGMWILGNNYRGSGYYGSYPPNYLKRVMAMFPDAERVLHLFSGSLPQGNYVRFDVNDNADVRGDAHELSTYFPPGHFELIVADPPYSPADAVRYGTPMINRILVLKEATTVLVPGGFIVWLDHIWPMFSKKSLALAGLIGVVRSTNHRVRLVSIFQKVAGGQLAADCEPSRLACSRPPGM